MEGWKKGKKKGNGQKKKREPPFNAIKAQTTTKERGGIDLTGTEGGGEPSAGFRRKQKKGCAVTLEDFYADKRGFIVIDGRFLMNLPDTLKWRGKLVLLW